MYLWHSEKSDLMDVGHLLAEMIQNFDHSGHNSPAPHCTRLHISIVFQTIPVNRAARNCTGISIVFQTIPVNRAARNCTGISIVFQTIPVNRAARNCTRHKHCLSDHSGKSHSSELTLNPPFLPLNPGKSLPIFIA